MDIKYLFTEGTNANRVSHKRDKIGKILPSKVFLRDNKKNQVTQVKISEATSELSIQHSTYNETLLESQNFKILIFCSISISIIHLA